MSETPGRSGWEPPEDREPDPLLNPQGFGPRQSSQPPPAEQVHSLIRTLAFLAAVALVVIAIFVFLAFRSLDNLVL